jgi:hypothetical protein
MGDFAPRLKGFSGARLLLLASREGRSRNVEKPDQRQKLSRRSQNYVPTHRQRNTEASWFAQGIQLASVFVQGASAAPANFGLGQLRELRDETGFNHSRIL